MKRLPILLLLMVSTSCFAWSLFGPKNYDECVIENMKGVNTDVGAKLVNSSCLEKFKRKEVDNSQIHEWVIFDSDEKASRYWDRLSISRHGKVVTVYEVSDFNKLQSESFGQFYSIMVNVEYDCVSRVHRYLNVDFKTSHMGDGGSIYQIGLINDEKPTSEGVYKRYCMG